MTDKLVVDGMIRETDVETNSPKGFNTVTKEGAGCRVSVILKNRGDDMKRTPLVKGLFLLGAAISFLLSIHLWFNGQKDEGVFVGIWVPSILSLGTLLLTGRRADNE